MPAPDLSTRQIALLFKDLVHYICFRCSCTVFTNNFLLISIFYPALRQQGFPKFMQAGDLSKLEISKTFYTHYSPEWLLSILERYRPRKHFFLGQVISIFTPSCSHWELFISVCRQTTYQTKCHEQYFFVPTFYKKNSIFCRWNKSTCDFIPHLFVSIFLRFDRCSLTSPLVAKANQFTNLQTHSGLEGICLFRKKAFQFELLFYCLLFAN